MIFLKKFVLFLLLCFAAVFTASAQFTAPNVPLDEQKALYREALKQVFVVRKDLVDYRYIEDKEKILFLDQMPLLEQIEEPPIPMQKGLVPEQIDSVKFKVLSAKQLKRKARKGNLLYARLHQIGTYTGDYAVVSVELNWEMSKRSIKRGLLYKSAGGNSMLFQKKDGKWTYIKTFNKWIN